MTETKKETPTSELAEMSGKSLDKVTVEDATGKKWDLLPLDMTDIMDYERLVGQSLFDADMRTVKIREILCLLYLSLRKTGLSKADIEAEKWVWPNERACMRLFSGEVIMKTPEIFAALLRISGLSKEKNEKDPHPADQ